MKASAFFIAVLLIVSCSSSVIMGISYHENHCHDWKDCAIWCKQYIPQPQCINHICNCKPKSLTTNDEIAKSTSSYNLND
ncbi:defensin-like protein 308 [Capsella rubella]|nr:defensin-like protein 308 [Capsella rubella]